MLVYQCLFSDNWWKIYCILEALMTLMAWNAFLACLVDCNVWKLLLVNNFF